MKSKGPDTTNDTAKESQLYRTAHFAGFATAATPSYMATTRLRKPTREVTAPAAAPT